MQNESKQIDYVAETARDRKIFSEDQAKQLMQEYIKAMDQYEEILNKIKAHSAEEYLLLSHECPERFMLAFLKIQYVLLPELLDSFANNQDDEHVRNLILERDKILAKMHDTLERLQRNIKTKQQQLSTIVECQIKSMVQDAAARKAASDAYQGFANVIVNALFANVEEIAKTVNSRVDCYSSMLEKYYLVRNGVKSMEKLVDLTTSNAYAAFEPAKDKILSVRDNKVLDTITREGQDRGTRFKN